MTASGGNGQPSGGGRDWLSRTLRSLREDAGVSGKEAGAAIGKSQPRISRIEGGRSLPSPSEVRALCALYKAPAGVRRELVQAATDLQGGTYPARVVMSRGHAWKMQRRIAQAEARASQIQNFQPAIISGLLQTPAYMRLVFADAGLTAEDQEQSAAQREARSAALTSGRDITIVMTEGALRWQGGSPQIMTEQLGHIAEGIRAWPQSVRVGIIPVTRPVRVFPTHGFSVYDQRVAIVGIWTGTTFMDAAPDVAEFVKLFGELEALAVFGDEALDVIDRVAGEYREME